MRGSCLAVIAQSDLTLLQEFSLPLRNLVCRIKSIFTIVEDGGGNLSTASKALTGNNMVRCSAMGRQRPYEPICVAHKINNACNAAMKVAKESKKEVSTKCLQLYLC